MSCPFGRDRDRSEAGVAANRQSSESRRTYTRYLRLHELLALQDGDVDIDANRQISNDETHFIIVHQAFELWFKMVQIELRCARDILWQDFVPERAIPQAAHHMGRVSEIFRLLAQQWKVMQTLIPQDFLDFRDSLGTASGFQSFQMRGLELLIGLQSSDRVNAEDPLRHLEELSHMSDLDRAAWENIKKIQSEPTLADALRKWLERTPIRGSLPSHENDAAVVSGFIEEYLAKAQKAADEAAARLVADGADPVKSKERFDAKVQEAADFLKPDGKPDRSRAGLLFIESYRDLPLLVFPRTLVDACVTLEESMVIFRLHHARTVERIIGRRVGTGGTSGVDYLDATARYRVFKDLWAIRTLLLKRSELPPLDDHAAGFYGLRAEDVYAKLPGTPPKPIVTEIPIVPNLTLAE